ncbi:nitric-oxide reductase large subunit [Geomesophilobacter sediminis]|uniref:Cbb3-type cytochrome c oxidase subunit I n=1 Tax=Geomesophilobacter sediminis TaxID=2798584 RepID=A0A8J7JG46_9BACT|nr:cbb3-type cytochrome c oxidase subunit I [Geomesophilobacter sediminis]MBJ6725514.1 cbb3-type cytochrome c oxidase subunit I [Geomesophilobacter sediminis]
MYERRKDMILSPGWLVTAIVTFVFGFTVLGYLAFRDKTDKAPVPVQVLASDGSRLYTGNDIIAGQNLFQKYGLMQYGTIFGHGAYLGPDFTAQYLHLAGDQARLFYAAQKMSPADAEQRVRAEQKMNNYQAGSGILTFSPGQTAGYRSMIGYYQQWFGPPNTQQGLQRPYLRDPEDIRKLTSYFSWAAWLCAAQRPGTSHSYTNNWPPDDLADNKPTPGVVMWSVLSLVALLCGAGIIFFLFGRYEWLGWHAAEEYQAEAIRPPEDLPLTPSQRTVAWYFLVVSGLFLVLGLLGGVNAHYHVERAGFYGVSIASLLPYNLSRMWHVQVSLFFVASSFLAMGIFLAPMIAGKEPRHQDKLSLVLLAALVVVVVGSLSGEAASLSGKLPEGAPWFWIGSQGWEYLDLGRLWQILLTAGMLIWLFILVRGMRERLKGEHPGNMPWLFIYSAVSIPLFYAAGMLYGETTHFTQVEFWRFWVVHLWVEDFLELFTTIMVAFVFVLLGVVRVRVATTIIYLDIILYSVGGVIGTMHHLYFSGTPEMHMAWGAFFSAMEVIPLLLLTYEAWRFMRLGAPAGNSMLSTAGTVFPHKWAVMFLIAVGFWNFLGAGVFGFLINLPIVSYYEIGTQWTANHGHAALMGVYGMLSLGFFMFVTRYFVPLDRASNRAMAIAFWCTNLGLAWMLFINLFPVGLLQMNQILATAYWHGREPDFFSLPLVRLFEWLRFPGDALFIVGILPVVYLAVRMFLNRKREGVPAR